MAAAKGGAAAGTQEPLVPPTRGTRARSSPAELSWGVRSRGPEGGECEVRMSNGAHPGAPSHHQQQGLLGAPSSPRPRVTHCVANAHTRSAGSIPKSDSPSFPELRGELGREWAGGQKLAARPAGHSPGHQICLSLPPRRVTSRLSFLGVGADAHEAALPFGWPAGGTVLKSQAYLIRCTFAQRRPSRGLERKA